MRLCLVEDNGAARLEPLTLTRPVFDLLLGARTLGDKIADAFKIGPGPARRGAIVRPYLASVHASATRTRAVNDRDWQARGPLLVANGAGFLPPISSHPIPPPLGWALATACRPAPCRTRTRRDARIQRRRFLVRSLESRPALDRSRRRMDQPSLGPRFQERAHLHRDFLAQGQVEVSNRHLAAKAHRRPGESLVDP